MSDEEVNVTDDDIESSASSCSSLRTINRKLAIANLAVFCGVIRERLKRIKSNTKVDDCFQVYLKNLVKECNVVFVDGKRSHYQYTQESYLHLQLSPTGYEIAHPEYDEKALLIKESLKVFSLDMQNIIQMVESECLVAIRYWIQHQIVIFLNYTQVVGS